MAGYIGKTVPTAQVKSTTEGRALLEAQSVEEQRISLDVYSQAEIDTNIYTKTEVDANIYTQVEADAKLALQPPIIPTSTMLQGDLSLTNTVKELGAGKFLYTGNGTSQEINVGVSSIDFTQSSNGTGFYHDRTAGDGIVKTDAGTIVESGEIAFKDVAGVDGVCQVHIKSRSLATNNLVYDGIRGVGEHIVTDSTGPETYNVTTLTGFTLNGLAVGNNAAVNENLATYIAYITLYTHIKWGLTSQGKRYIEAYNPVTNMGMILYQGSGAVGHQIPHSAGVELDYFDVKTLGFAYGWVAYFGDETAYMSINETGAKATYAGYWNNTPPTSNITLGLDGYVNGAYTYVAYYKAKSKIWTCGIYTGTGAAGNFVETVDSDGVACEPHQLIIKRVDSTSNWMMFDNKRSDLGSYLNLSNTETDWPGLLYTLENGFKPNRQVGDDFDINAAGGQYFYQAFLIPAQYSADVDGYFDNPTDTTQLQLTDGIYSISDGYGANGAVNEIVSKTGTVTPTGGWKE